MGRMTPFAVLSMAIAFCSLPAVASPTVGGCAILPADNYWNTPVDTLPVHASSASWVGTIGTSSRLHADWVGLFRTAQCAGTQAGAQVYAQVESISSGFANSGEYTGKGRTNAQYVGDLYNAFLRRGGDLACVQSWINQLNAGSSRDTIRCAFISTGEFNARVNALTTQGCLP